MIFTLVDQTNLRQIHRIWIKIDSNTSFEQLESIIKGKLISYEQTRSNYYNQTPRNFDYCQMQFYYQVKDSKFPILFRDTEIIYGNPLLSDVWEAGNLWLIHTIGELYVHIY